MKKIAVFLVSLIFLSFLYITNYNIRMINTKSFLESTTLFFSERKVYEDLYHFAYLREYKRKLTDSASFPIKPDEKIKKVNLYYVGDSYLYLFLHDKKREESKFKSVHKGVWESMTESQLDATQMDTSEVNILIFERNERFMKELKDKEYVFTHIISPAKPVIPARVNSVNKNPGFWTKVENMLWHIDWLVQSSIYNVNTEGNLNVLFFDYWFFNRVKELKAYINYHMFDRVDKDVCLSEDRKYMFIKESVDTTNKSSSFYPVSDKEIDSLALTLNYVSTVYKDLGFDEVFFSFPPSPVSIIEPQRGQYNYLVPRLQNNSLATVNFIDIYTPFKKTTKQVYYNADTHWNHTGFNMWMNELYKKIDTLALNNTKVQKKLRDDK